ncbi:endonuclease domain-containing protein [Streptomyces cavernae]|uniref:endonuclease domain-containing protein n=1 Tax=Streptomyces cavernae TaxID=2259034 RepID=UPI000FEBFB10|nr:endonuclease domain-containing protein [Streptomyces cavernae]
MTTAPPPGRLYGKGHSENGKQCHHWSVYGLTCHEYEELRVRARGCCEICGVSEDDTHRRLLLIDHFEGNGSFSVRGLICAKCNSVMACFDGRKPWGANRRWEGKASGYVAVSRLWDAYGRICERLNTDRTNDLLGHMRARVLEHGDDQDRADLEKAEQELAERRARKGGRPKREPAAGD